MQYDILVPGNYFCDIIFTGIPQLPALGTEIYTDGLTVTLGGVLNTVVGLRRLGVNVGWLAMLGNDFFSRYVQEQLHTEDVSLELVSHIDAPLQRVTVALSYPHDRAFVTYVDPAPTSIDLVEAALDTLHFRHLHFTGLQTDPRTPQLLRRVRQRGIPVSMDCQHRPVSIHDPIVREVLSLTDIFMPNATEACLLTGCTSLHDAAPYFLALVPTLIIKDGANGVWAWHQGEQMHLPPIDVMPLDTTGAGDVFNAAFLAAHLQGNAFTTCLQWGNTAGGLSTRGYGGAANAPTQADLAPFLI